MKCFLTCAVLAALPAPGQPAAITPIILYTQFAHDPSPPVLAAIRQEVGNILSPLGLPLTWKDLAGASGREPASEVAIITFQGRCSVGNPLFPTTSSAPLGVTHVTDGVVLPFTDIDCDRIRDFLAKDLVRREAQTREAVFGRAVGRVVAHELFHIFGGGRHHGAAGVAAPVFTKSELMSERFQLAVSELRILRASLKPARKQAGLLRSAASPLSGQSIFLEDGCVECHGAHREGTRSAPALRGIGRLLDAKGLAAKLTHDLGSMYSRIQRRRLPTPALDDEEIADLVSYLGGSL